MPNDVRGDEPSNTRCRVTCVIPAGDLLHCTDHLCDVYAPIEHIYEELSVLRRDIQHLSLHAGLDRLGHLIGAFARQHVGQSQFI